MNPPPNPGSPPIDSSRNPVMPPPLTPPPPKFLKPQLMLLQTEPDSSQNEQEPTPVAKLKEAHIPEAPEAPLKSSNSEAVKEKAQAFQVPYSIPQWSEPPSDLFSFEILKDGSIIDQIDVSEKGAYMFGRVELCDFILEHPTISRFHAVLQFKGSSYVYLYDLGSTHGTFINKNEIKKKVYVELHVGDVIRFGRSSRLYILQGPAELMPPETDLKAIRNAKAHEEIQDLEASLRRARQEASIADGISWGMGEDAIEEAEDDVDEVTWQTYKGQLTEKQEKTREKVLKRTEKIAHMKKEIDAIRVKDIPQGGLTQGQQTQIARNEQRIAQILEELENLEETLNESIRESLGARTGKGPRGRRKGEVEGEEETISDDDEFYDRTKKPNNKVGENQTIETADSLLDKKDAILKEMDEKTKLLSIDRDRLESKTTVANDAGDSLDAYMSGLSSQLVLDKAEQLQAELSTLQSELDRILYLLKIADPAGDAAKKRELKACESKPECSEKSTPAILSQTSKVQKKANNSKKAGHISNTEQGDIGSTMEGTKKAEPENMNKDSTDGKAVVYTVVKPQWLGAVEDRITEDKKEKPLDMHESDQFVDYKDRMKVLSDAHIKKDPVLDEATSGLIIRKRKQVEVEGGDNKQPEQSTSSNAAQNQVEDAVALLLKHTRGYHESEDNIDENQGTPDGSGSKKKGKKPKRVLGPDRPSFLDSDKVYEEWVPPEGQSGDGRTSLNDRLGY